MLIFLIFLLYAASATYIYADYDAPLNFPQSKSPANIILPIPSENYLPDKTVSQQADSVVAEKITSPIPNDTPVKSSLAPKNMHPTSSAIPPTSTEDPYSYGLPHQVTVFLLHLSLVSFGLGMILLTTDEWLRLFQEIKAFLFPTRRTFNPSENRIHSL